MKPETFTLCTVLIWGIIFFDVALSTDDLSDKVNSKSVTEIAAPGYGKIRVYKRTITLVKNDQSPSRLFRRQIDTRTYGLYDTQTLNILRYVYPPNLNARIGDTVFSCRQDDGILVINRDGSATPELINGLYEWHPAQGIWWFIRCYEVNSRAGGYGLDMTSAQKPGGDSGLNPAALKSLVG